MISIFFIGSGRLAGNLAHAFKGSDIEITGVFSRSKQNGEKFSEDFNTKYFSDLTSIPGNCDIYFLAVSDQAIAEVSDKINVNGLVVHCSGMLGIDILKKHKLRGVFWPVQTLSRDHFADFDKVAICIETYDELDRRLLEVLADKISRKVFWVNEIERKKYHLAAVFVNNFSNHLYALAKDYLDSNQLSFEILKPLILETANKINTMDPNSAQTGPAIRNDLLSVEIHRNLLADNEKLLEIYDLLTTSILNTKS